MTTDTIVAYNPAMEGTHPETDDFSLANGPWKYDANFVKIPATQQEWQDAQKDPEVEKLKQALLDFDSACQALQDAAPATYGAYWPLFKPFANSLRTAMIQVYKSLQTP